MESGALATLRAPSVSPARQVLRCVTPMRDPNDGSPTMDVDGLRREAHRLRQVSLALARQAFAAQIAAKEAGALAHSAENGSTRASPVDAELRQAVAAFATQCRALGASPEAVVIAVRGICLEAAQDELMFSVHRGTLLQLTYDLVHHAARAYYES